MLDEAGIREAPFHRGLAQGPAEAEARWLAAADGVRLRAVNWGRRARRGTVLILSGRTEYAEKYGRVAAELRARGFAVLTLDWRGQGLSERLRADPTLGHVGRFGDYQLDVAALVAHGRALGLPEPWFMLAHSMGGAIGLRALLDGLPVRAAAFSAPMWGFHLTAALRPTSWTAGSVGRAFVLGHLPAAERQPTNYLLRCDFAANPLTSDRETWEWLRAQVASEPGLALGGPTLHWLNEAVREMWRLSLEPAPGVPALALMGTEETVVDPGRIRRRLSDWPGARLVTMPGARHEVLMETPTIRSRALAEIAAHFTQNR